MEIFFQKSALTAIHAHISLWNGLDTCRRNIKYLFCVRNSVKYLKVALSSKFVIVKLYRNFYFEVFCSHA
jgi:hypothetical protein